MNVDGCRLVSRWGDAELNVGNQQVDVGYAPIGFERLQFGVVRDGHVVGNAKDLHVGMRFDRLEILFPIAEVIVQNGIRGVKMQVPPTPF